MQKYYLEPREMLHIAEQHANCALHLLSEDADIRAQDGLAHDALLPVISLLHLAVELTLKACLLYEHRQIRHYKKLSELVAANRGLHFSKVDLELIQTLGRQMAYRKGVDYDLWESREQQFIFCKQMSALYLRLLKQLPLELTDEYHR